jgi:hypothetical protein
MEAKTKTVTKAGIHAEVEDYDGNIPITVFVARDHNLSNPIFHTVNDNDVIIVKVIGIRYELNDPYVCVIASILSKKESRKIRGDEDKDKDIVVNKNYDVMNVEYDDDLVL